jgi:hypothetical protein
MNKLNSWSSSSKVAFFKIAEMEDNFYYDFGRESFPLVEENPLVNLQGIIPSNRQSCCEFAGKLPSHLRENSFKIMREFLPQSSIPTFQGIFIGSPHTENSLPFSLTFEAIFFIASNDAV